MRAVGQGRSWPLAAGRGLSNAFLWPMPWIHRLGNDGYLGRPDCADPPFGQKLDRAVWRGELSGHVLDGDGQPRPLHQAVGDLLAGNPEAAVDLRAATRVALVLDHRGSPDAWMPR